MAWSDGTTGQGGSSCQGGIGSEPSLGQLGASQGRTLRSMQSNPRASNLAGSATLALDARAKELIRS
ncbi:MAG TPA: hypothetical protein QF446_10635, partial [Planctomycetota bacterium]|nr:hypothetical protein [Planctomycetota bacterium]